MTKFLNHQNRLLALACMLFACLSSYVPACASADVESSEKNWDPIMQSSQKTYLSDNDKDGRDCIERMVKAADDINDYTFDYQMNVFKKTKGHVTSQSGHFDFKKPRKIRLEVTDGLNEGSVAVMTQPGKVRGHFGGMLSLFVGNVGEHSAYLRSPNGWPLVDSDFLSLAQAIRGYVVTDGHPTKVTRQAVEWSDGKRYLVLELYEGPGDMRVWKRVIVDSNSYLPAYWFDYQNGKLWTYSFWKNVRINPGIADSVFQL